MYVYIKINDKQTMLIF